MAKLFEKTVVMDGKAIERALTRIAHEIIEKIKALKMSSLLALETWCAFS